MKTVTLRAALSVLLLNGSHLFADAPFLYQEPLGTQTSYVVPFASWQYLGIRFQTTQATHLTSIHTEMALLSPGASSYFAALVPLPTVTSHPLGDPFLPGEVIYSTVFSLNSGMYVWTPMDIPFSVSIDPGAYAVVLGAGQFGSIAPVDGILRVYNEVPASTGFSWGNNGNGWNENTAYSWDISVAGTIVPEPSLAALGVAGLCSMILLHRRKPMCT